MKFSLRILYLSTILTYSNVTLSEETYVYCSNQNKNWYWLENGNVKIQGVWKFMAIDLKNLYNYFILKEGILKYFSLKSQCINEFGKDYIYPQPANQTYSKWAPFALNEDQILPGHISFLTEDFYLRVNEKIYELPYDNYSN